jgi:hypothetical protein
MAVFAVANANVAPAVIVVKLRLSSIDADRPFILVKLAITLGLVTGGTPAAHCAVSPVPN